MAPVGSSTTIRQMEHKNKGNLVIGIGPTFTPLNGGTPSHEVSIGGRRDRGRVVRGGPHLAGLMAVQLLGVKREPLEMTYPGS
jgi:hypothetical protein